MNPTEIKHRRTFRNGAQPLVACALVEQGLTTRTVGKIVGSSPSSVSRWARKNRISPAHLQAVQQSLQARFALLADAILNSIDRDKIASAGLGEAVRALATTMELAGVRESPSLVLDRYFAALSQYGISPGLPHSSPEAVMSKQKEPPA